MPAAFDLPVRRIIGVGGCLCLSCVCFVFVLCLFMFVLCLFMFVQFDVAFCPQLSKDARS